MKPLDYILFQLGLIKITAINIKSWTHEKNISRLILSLKKGKYKMRILAAQNLGQLKAKQAIPALEKSVEDECLMVGKAALMGLRSFTKSKYLI